MSFFEDQMDDWFANDCKGDPSDYYAGEIGPWVDEARARQIAGEGTPGKKPKTEAQKAKKRRQRQRSRANRAARLRAEGKAN